MDAHAIIQDTAVVVVKAMGMKGVRLKLTLREKRQKWVSAT